MGGIYQRVRTGATVILLAAILHAPLSVAAEPATLLWTQPSGLASGSRFMAIGYGRGIELWDWPEDDVPRLNQRLAGPAVTALWGKDSTLYWGSSDSTLREAVLQGSIWEVSPSRELDGAAASVSGSNEFIAAVIGTSHMRFASRQVGADSLWSWQPPGARPVAFVSVRDSTAAVVGADRAFLVRLRSTGALLLDSLALGAFVQAAQWAGDSLFLAFGYSGVRLATTSADHFTGALQAWSSGGSFGRLVLTETACTAVDVFGDMEIFERGQSLSPRTRVSYGGTPRAAVGRDHLLALLTVERGLALLNLFTLSSPFWTYQAPFPGFTRDLASSLGHVYALTDFAGAYELGPEERLVVSHPYNATALDVRWPHLAATSLLGGVAVAELDTDTAQPYAVVPALGFGRRSVIVDDRLFVAGDDLCDTGLVVYHLQPPQTPAELQRLAVCGSLTSMAGGPGVLAIALRDSGLKVFDAMMPELGALDSLPAVEVFDELAWQDSLLWGRSRTGQLVQWLWDGQRITEERRFDVPGLRAFDVWQTTVATADSGRHVTAWRWTSGATLEPIDSVVTATVASNVAVLGDTVWASDGDALLRFELPRTSDVREPVVIPASALLDVPFPNPFNGSVEFTLHPNRGAWSVRIVDILGRSVQRWSGVARSSGPVRLEWNPSGSGGAASGLYLIQATHEGTRQSRKVVYLK